MRLIDADRLLDRCKFYHLPNGDIAVPIIDVQHAPTIEMVEQLPPAQLGTNLAEVGTDCISRQAAIEEIERWLGYIDDDMVRRMQIGIKRLPPAQPEPLQPWEVLAAQAVLPQPKMGKWIYHIDDLFPAESTMECNQCHAEQPLTCDDEFCPHCGAKMDVTE